MHNRPSPHIPGFERRPRRNEPRASDLIGGITAVTALVAGCLHLLSALA